MMSNSKKKEKEDNTKKNDKTPAYKFQSNIEPLINIIDIFEEKILNAKIEFILREAFDIIKKVFYELIIEVIKRKWKIISETIIAKIFDTLMTKEKEEEIGEVFSLICDNLGSGN